MSADTLQFIDGRGYVWVNGSSGQTLIRFKPDGSGHENVCTAATGGQGISRSVIVGDICYADVYYAQDRLGSDVEGICEISLKTGDVALIAMSNEGSGWSEHQIKSLYFEEGALFYQLTEYRSGEARSRFYTYDCSKKENALLYETDHAAAITKMDNTLICYEYMVYGMDRAEESVWLFSLEDGSRSPLSIPFGSPSWDGEHLFITTIGQEDVRVYVFDSDFRAVTEIVPTLDPALGFIVRHTLKDHVVFTQRWLYDDDPALYATTCQLYPKSLLTDPSGSAFEVTILPETD